MRGELALPLGVAGQGQRGRAGRRWRGQPRTGAEIQWEGSISSGAELCNQHMNTVVLALRAHRTQGTLRENQGVLLWI